MTIDLNYLWISNKAYYDPTRFVSGSPIPAELINNVFDVAEKHRTIHVNLWCGFSLSSEADSHFLEQLKSKPENLTYCDLRQLLAFRAINIFEGGMKEPHKTIWHAVDTARLVILDHALTKGGADIAIYSDLDVIDPPLSSSRLLTVLDHFGIVFNAEEGYIENQFIGFHKKRQSLLSKFFIPATQAQGHENAHDGWWAFRTGMEEILCVSGVNVEDASVEIKTLSGAPCTPYTFDKNLLVKGQTKVPIAFSDPPQRNSPFSFMRLLHALCHK